MCCRAACGIGKLFRVLFEILFDSTATEFTWFDITYVNTQSEKPFTNLSILVSDVTTGGRYA